MSTKLCITFESCISNDLVYVETIAGSPLGLFLIGELNNIVQITNTVGFPDELYTVISICNSFEISDPACNTCFQNDTLLDLENVKSTELESCSTTAYVLVNCNINPETLPENPENIIQSPQTALVTISDLQFYVGSVVNIEEHPGNCYLVTGPFTEDTGCPCPEYTVTNAFEDCECCTPDVPIKRTQSVLEPVKIFYRILQSNCDVKANIRFANTYYNYFKSIAYGMGDCCNNTDLDKTWLKKELSNLNQIYDPSLCVTPPNPPEELVCEGPAGVLCEPIDFRLTTSQIIF